MRALPQTPEQKHPTLKLQHKYRAAARQPESVKKVAKRDRHVAALLAMTYQKAILCVIAVKIAPNCVIASV